MFECKIIEENSRGVSSFRRHYKMSEELHYHMQLISTAHLFMIKQGHVNKKLH